MRGSESEERRPRKGKNGGTRLILSPRRTGLAATLGGLFWVPYGIFELLEPWGPDVAYRDERGYSVVIDTPAFVAYSLPGSVGLLLVSLGLLGLIAHLLISVRRRSASRLLAYLALLLAIVSLIGVVLAFDPLFTGGRVFGSLVLGIATLSAAAATRSGRVDRSWTLLLAILGAMGILLLPLWPLIYALGWLPAGVGAAFIGLFGISWAAAGVRLWLAAQEL